MRGRAWCGLGDITRCFTVQAHDTFVQDELTVKNQIPGGNSSAAQMIHFRFPNHVQSPKHAQSESRQIVSLSPLPPHQVELTLCVTQTDSSSMRRCVDTG